jgi:hypothetical protein
MVTQGVSGGCQCGRIRYSAQVENFDAYLCHCRMCQRATGGVSIAFKNVPKSARTWEAEPEWYHSSPIARRPFCSACGTPLGFEFIDGENCDLTVGSIDEAALFVPTSQFGVESRHDAWSNTADLPSMRCEENPALVKRWVDAGLEVPE